MYDPLVGSPAKTPAINNDVVKMVEAGLSEDLIITKIRSNEQSFVLDTDSLVALKKAGVSDKVIAAMMERQGR